MDGGPLTQTSPEISHRGILTIMAAVIFAGSALGFGLGGPRFGSGVVFGGALAFANYFWLERSTRAIFKPHALSTPGILAAKYILRYVAIGAVLLLVNLTGALPVAAVILGLGAFAFAVVLQGLKNIISNTV